MDQTPTIGRIVHYQLDDDDVELVNRARARAFHVDGKFGGRLDPAYQAHHGSQLCVGDTVALTITKVWPGNLVNGQALLDGTDSVWVKSAKEGSGPGEWSWPPRA